MGGIYLALANLSCGIVCLSLGFVFRNYKNAANLIAGYNTLSQEEKAKYNSKELCRFIKKLLFSEAAFMIITGIMITLDIAVWVMLIGSWSVFTVTMIIAIVYRSRNKGFKA